MNESDISIKCTKDASVHWSAYCKATHRPTGLTVEWVETWRDKINKRIALRELASRVDAQERSQ